MLKTINIISVSAVQGFESSLIGRFWLRVSYATVVKMWAGAAAIGRLDRGWGPTSKTAHSIVGKLMAGYWKEASAASHVTPHRAWMLSRHGGWLPPGWATQERTRQKQPSFLWLGLVHTLPLSPHPTGHTDQPWSEWGDYTRAWILGGENHWGPSRRLAPANPIQYLHNILC